MLLLGIDLETTGVQFEFDEITEIGAVLWDTQTKSPVSIVNELISISKNDVSPEITKLTGITNKLLVDHGSLFRHVYPRVLSLAKQAEYIVAHNGNAFDKPFLKAVCRREAVKPLENKWLDTMIDIPYPEEITTRKLSYLAAEHGFVNPFAHRAVFDVLTMFKVLDQYPIEEVIAYSLLDDITLKAVVSFKEKDKAKALKYRWNAETKEWLKIVKETQTDKEIAKADFKVIIKDTK